MRRKESFIGVRADLAFREPNHKLFDPTGVVPAKESETGAPNDLSHRRSLVDSHAKDRLPREQVLVNFPRQHAILKLVILEEQKRIGPALREQGMIFVGIDVIGDYLTEINVTSPTGLQEVARFDGVQLEAYIWDAIEARLSAG